MSYIFLRCISKFLVVIFEMVSLQDSSVLLIVSRSCKYVYEFISLGQSQGIKSSLQLQINHFLAYSLLKVQIVTSHAKLLMYSCAQNKPIGSHIMKQNADFKDGISQA